MKRCRLIVSEITAIVQAGKDLGLKGKRLENWVKEQQDEARSKREAEHKLREIEQQKLEIEREKEKAAKELEELKLEIEREKEKTAKELEEKKLDIEREKEKAAKEVEEKKLDVEKHRLQCENEKMQTMVAFEKKVHEDKIAKEEKIELEKMKLETEERIEMGKLGVERERIELEKTRLEMSSHRDSIDWSELRNEKTDWFLNNCQSFLDKEAETITKGILQAGEPREQISDSVDSLDMSVVRTKNRDTFENKYRSFLDKDTDGEDSRERVVGGEGQRDTEKDNAEFVKDVLETYKELERSEFPGFLELSGIDAKHGNEPSSNSATFTDNSSSDVLSRDTSPSPPPAASRRGRKRRGGGGGSTGATPRRNTKRSRKDDSLPQELTVQTSTPVGGAPILSSPPAQPPPDANFVLKFTYGVNAFRHWVAQKNTALEQAGKKHKPFRSDLLAATADELNTALTLFVREVRKPNGEVYAPDSIFYLCLGIQQYLFENNRIDNIFTDIYFEQFTDKLNNVLHNYEVRLNQQGLIVCRIEEEHLWEAKLLGAHSPHVLLHSLIYFNAKFFMLRTAEEHLALSAACISKHWRKIGVLSKPARQMYLRYCPPVDASKRARMKEEPPSFEQLENTENPLRCPVKLYEFFLSKCPESVRSRNDGFYLVPESSCVPDSPVWYSTAPLGAEAMTKMLNRVRVVKEIQEAHLHYQPGY